MTSPCCIAINTENSFRAIKCWADGSLPKAGVLLFNKCQQSGVEQIIATGDIASLETPVGVGQTAKTFNSLADLRWAYVDCPNVYMWQDDRWLYSPTVSGPTEGKFVPLESALRKFK